MNTNDYKEYADKTAIELQKLLTRSITGVSRTVESFKLLCRRAGLNDEPAMIAEDGLLKLGYALAELIEWRDYMATREDDDGAGNEEEPQCEQ